MNNTRPALPSSPAPTFRGLTPRQSARFAAASAKLPPGWTYHLHDEGDGLLGVRGKPFREARPWGVTVYDEKGKPMGHVQAPKQGFMEANRHRPAGEVARLAVNRAAAALWHRQPVWSE